MILPSHICARHVNSEAGEHGMNSCAYFMENQIKFSNTNKRHIISKHMK